MKVSIIVPVYNVEDYIEQCLTSILKQDYYDIELIVINDGSTDKSGSLCEKFTNDKRMIYVIQENLGLSVARNRGVEIATGDYAFFLDSDDYLVDNSLSLLISKIEPNIDVLITGYFTEYLNRRVKTYGENERIVSGKQVFLETLRCRVPHVAWGKIYSRKIYKSLSFPSGKMCEDLAEITLCYQNASFVKFIPDELLVYRRRKGSIMHSYKSKLIYDSCFVLDDLEKRLDKELSNKDVRDAFDTKFLHIMISNINISLRAHDYEMAHRLAQRLKLDTYKRSMKYMRFNYKHAYRLIKICYPIYILLNYIFINKIKYNILKIE